jgi:hypothetical protein
MTPPFNWKMFACELVVYAALVLAYFALVLHFMADWLKNLFDHNRTTFAIVALLLMIGQAVGLEVINSLLFKLLRMGKK